MYMYIPSSIVLSHTNQRAEPTLLYMYTPIHILFRSTRKVRMVTDSQTILSHTICILTTTCTWTYMYIHYIKPLYTVQYTCTCTCTRCTNVGIYCTCTCICILYMNNHLYRTPQCEKERIRKRKRKKDDTLTHEYTTTPFPPHMYM